MSDFDDRIWRRFFDKRHEQRMQPRDASKRNLMREVEKLKALMREKGITPETMHGQKIHFAQSTWDYGGIRTYHCIDGYWLSEGMVMTEGGTMLMDFDPDSLHKPEDCIK